MELSLTSHLKLEPLEILRDRKNYIVEDLASGEFYEMPEVCIAAVKMIQNDIALGEIEILLKQKYPREEVDLLDFASQLVELKLVEEIDGLPIETNQKKQQIQGFKWISPKAGRFFFNRFSMFVYAVLFVVNLTLLIFHPNLFPQYQDLFISDVMVLNIPAWIMLTFVLVLIHEFGHILAIRSYNLPTKLEIGHRLFLVVLETDMSSVWKLSPKNRNKLYCAGLCFDLLIIFAALLGQLAFSDQPLIIHGVLRMIVLDTFIRMIFQLCIYMKTDLYYVFENCTGCYNLMENAQQLFRKRFNTAAVDGIFEGERKTVLFYTIFYFTGVILTIVLYSSFYIPQLIYSIKKVLPGFQKPASSLPFWDSTVFAVQVLIGFLLLVYSWIKKYRMTKEGGI
jgi:hypothetical protein